MDNIEKHRMKSFCEENGGSWDEDTNSCRFDPEKSFGDIVKNCGSKALEGGLISLPTGPKGVIYTTTAVFGACIVKESLTSSIEERVKTGTGSPRDTRSLATAERRKSTVNTDYIPHTSINRSFKGFVTCEDEWDFKRLTDRKIISERNNRIGDLRFNSIEDSFGDKFSQPHEYSVVNNSESFHHELLQEEDSLFSHLNVDAFDGKPDLDHIIKEDTLNRRSLNIPEPRSCPECGCSMYKYGSEFICRRCGTSIKPYCYQ